MSLFHHLLYGANKAASKEINLEVDRKEIDEEVLDSSQNFADVTAAVAEAAKESLSRRTLNQYEKYYSYSSLDVECIDIQQSFGCMAN